MGFYSSALMMPPMSEGNYNASLTVTALPPQIGKYRVIRRLGEGATSDVFLAQDSFNGMEVAIKRMRAWASSGADSEVGLRFYSAEAALAGKLFHPNVVQILDAVPESDSPYLVME